ncbi:hypothetical protein [Streptomyces chromofuscus]|uniref:Uncharacterized protein n=1 Tax=Streptomyces chromofuscus TaxID=42881 RepID=A0A7M2T7V6_STRCW|nr:hypothetical protein [Streptomyces chromofuscus]QOV44796.1 hypothetical protein IPT68_01905 [Streptomyces chromofuscus]GGT00134.1 hypothetical protein GCM10010254_20240 [Streptomyces chromofuscus]
MKGARTPLLRDDPLVRTRALLIARVAIAVHLVELVLNLTRPRLLPDEPALSIFYDLGQRRPGRAGSHHRRAARQDERRTRAAGGRLADEADRGAAAEPQDLVGAEYWRRLGDSAGEDARITRCCFAVMHRGDAT